MTQREEKISEFNRLFPGLDEEGKDRALSILGALEFAQSALCRAEKPLSGAKGEKTGIDVSK